MHVTDIWTLFKSHIKHPMSVSANTKCWSYAVSMLDHRLWRWPNIKPTNSQTLLSRHQLHCFSGPLFLCCFKDRSSSATLAQHRTNIRWTSYSWHGFVIKGIWTCEATLFSRFNTCDFSWKSYLEPICEGACVNTRGSDVKSVSHGERNPHQRPRARGGAKLAQRP